LLAISLVLALNSFPAALEGGSVPSLPYQQIQEDEFDMADPLRVYRNLQLPNLEISYFDISGDTPAALRAELDEHGPHNMKGQRCDAFTRWDIKWHWPVINMLPDFKRTEVTLSLNVSFPRWSSHAGAKPELVERWRKFSLAVAHHELGHIEQALSAYKGLRKEILLAARIDPDLSPQAANLLARNYVAKMQAADDRYDQLTNRGRRQGAEL